MISQAILRATMSYAIRPAVPGDERAVFALIEALARYARLAHELSGSAEALREHLFGPRPAAEALLAEDDAGGVKQAVGFALFFTNYSTFRTQPGIYLEDLFVVESHRRRGVGGALLAEVIRTAQARGAGRVEWTVLQWNESAIAFYRRLGADVLPDYRVCRISFGGPRHA
ncbi:MAG TPA: GNAT family N-acetyltransferase [Polyangia bacterium]|jgi:GNAT superfamily N-acetyltransferase